MASFPSTCLQLNKKLLLILFLSTYMIKFSIFSSADGYLWRGWSLVFFTSNQWWHTPRNITCTNFLSSRYQGPSFLNFPSTSQETPFRWHSWLVMWRDFHSMAVRYLLSWTVIRPLYTTTNGGIPQGIVLTPTLFLLSSTAEKTPFWWHYTHVMWLGFEFSLW